ncbi:MAG TPA: TOBE domain-containing protein, partial [Acetobacteraceae bacterium]|nr:TOBE domain-containing protein [Acetobacteraceae bacterium]
IGTPPMNLFHLERRGDGMVVRGTDGPIVSPSSGQDLLGGIRPESLAFGQEGIPAHVDYAEYLGADTVVVCRVGEEPMLVRLPGRVIVKSGTGVRLVTDAPLHLFDARSGARVEQVPALGEVVSA